MKLTRRKLAEYAAQQLEAGTNIADVMRDIAAHLIETKRVKESELIVRDIEARLLDRGMALVTVTSARPLSKNALGDIEQYVRDEQNVKSVIFREVIDESVIGGVRIALPGKTADFTVKAKLDTLAV